MYLVYCMETRRHNISYVCIENVCTIMSLSVLLCNVCVCYVYILKMSKKIKVKKKKNCVKICSKHWTKETKAQSIEAKNVSFVN